MRRITALMLGLLLIVLGAPGIAAGQNLVQIQGMIQSVDCQTFTLVLRGAGGIVNIVPGTGYTAVFVNGAPVGFCTLQQYIGGYAVASVTAVGSQWVAGRIDVVVAIAPPPPPPYYYPYPYGYPYYGPPIGIGIRILLGPGHEFHGREGGRHR